MLTNAPKGTKDILPNQSGKWQELEKRARTAASVFGAREIRTPVFEHTCLFERGMGGTTDVVQKEMYTFPDKKGRSLTLKPEGTAGAARAVIENGLLNDALPVKVYYFTPCFRYEAPQSGRLREHHQFGVEYFGAGSYIADAEIISLASYVLKNFGIEGLTLKINSVGCPSCRSEYQNALKAFFAPKYDSLCGLCKERLERNPMRLLDCKVPSCKPLREDAPEITDYLCENCTAHFEGVLDILNKIGMTYEIDPSLVRGLDYYTGPVFEFVPQREGGQTTICAGGRYDGLIDELGGKNTPALGFGMGIERVIAEIEEVSKLSQDSFKPDIFIASTGGKDENITAATLADSLRKMNISALTEISGRGLKAQMKYADKIGVRYVLVIGENEIKEGKAILKDMMNRENAYEVLLSPHIVGEKLTQLLQLKT